MKKQYIYLSIAAGVLFLIFIALLIFQSATNKQASQTSTVNGTPQNTKDANPQSSTNQQVQTNTQFGPDLAAKKFYSNYFSSPSNFLANYKNNTAISDELKSFIANFGSGKEDPVFCVQDHTTNPFFENATYSADKLTAYVTIRDGSENGRQLYAIEMDDINNSWLISSVQCL